MSKKTPLSQSREIDKVCRKIRGLLYDAHNLSGFEIPLLWAELVKDTEVLLAQIAKCYREGRPSLPEDPVWFYTTHKDSPLYPDDWDIPF